MTISADQPVCEIVIEHPETIPVLEHLGIDYCCDGTHTKAEACAKRDLIPVPVLEELERQQQDPDTPDIKWQKARSMKITEHIVHTHHTFAREHSSTAKRSTGPSPSEFLEIHLNEDSLHSKLLSLRLFLSYFALSAKTGLQWTSQHLVIRITSSPDKLGLLC
jgi:iron-sulfur cluster repair protein YtfE (RIC family)